MAIEHGEKVASCAPSRILPPYPENDDGSGGGTSGKYETWVLASQLNLGDRTVWDGGTIPQQSSQCVSVGVELISASLRVCEVCEGSTSTHGCLLYSVLCTLCCYPPLPISTLASRSVGFHG
ncbi:hypothetical protein N8T08_010914 [Aspergillus melleus]|uniref:Uncharacterized protein n=1 Tax=Aspergillus melleus TaxID=138277 RepID=A0ACC3AQT7_9EURO|nr:hypothetical protein N8T08_010914 [Aspergillus melleus]